MLANRFDPRAQLAALLLLFAIALAACATQGGDDENKIWMRDNSQYGLAMDRDACQAASIDPTDFHICMQSRGWRLQDPPAGD